MRSLLAPHRLRWIVVLAPVAALVVLEIVRRFVFEDVLSYWPAFLVMIAIWLAATTIFSRFVLAEIDERQSLLEQQNRELLSLHHASLAIESELDLSTVLQRVVDEAKNLLGVRYGGLTYLGDDGEIAQFIHSGIDPATRERMGAPPKGHGVIGVVTHSGQTLRLDDVTKHPQSVGFPENHPPMRPLLAVPITSKDGVVGHLYLADEAGVRFDARDEETVVRFAALAAVAIDNARLHEQVEAMAITGERERIAREMHDSLAQVLGYVNTKAQATSMLLKSGQAERAREHLDQMASAAREAYADVREGILSLRTSLDKDRTLIDTLREYLAQWEAQSGVRATLDDVCQQPGMLTDLEEVHLLRITQEALANVRKHAQATRVTITMECTGPDVVVTIVDNGIGFTPEERGPRGVPKFGMSTMRERAESLGGRFELTSRANEGTVVRVALPARRRP